MTNSKVEDLKKKCIKYARGVNRLNAFTLKYLSSIPSAGLIASAMQSIHAGADLGQHRNSLTASELKRVAPTKFDKMEYRLLKLLAGWSIQDIECLLVHRVISEAKRRAKVPR